MQILTWLNKYSFIQQLIQLIHAYNGIHLHTITGVVLILGATCFVCYNGFPEYLNLYFKAAVKTYLYILVNLYSYRNLFLFHIKDAYIAAQ